MPADVPAVLALVRALAAYEREPHAVAMTAADLHVALFDPDPSASCLVATDGPAPTSTDPGSVVGFAIWHRTFSTWTGQAGMHLVDLFVQPEHRRGGHGRALLAGLAGICVQRGWLRLEWAVLDWNTPAQEFYRSLSAGPLTGWMTWRLDGDALTRLATDT